MKILYIINSKEYSYHKNIITDFTRNIPGMVFDMGDGADYGMRYHEIEANSPDVIITFDLAGFELRTGGDTLSLNNLYARMAHILFHKPDYYGNNLRLRQNLSMFTYIPCDENILEYGSRYPEIPNICEFVSIINNADNDSDHKDNQSNIREWWEEFKKAAML